MRRRNRMTCKMLNTTYLPIGCLRLSFNQLSNKHHVFLFLWLALFLLAFKMILLCTWDQGFDQKGRKWDLWLLFPTLAFWSWFSVTLFTSNKIVLNHSLCPWFSTVLEVVERVPFSQCHRQYNHLQGVVLCNSKAHESLLIHKKFQTGIFQSFLKYTSI